MIVLQVNRLSKSFGADSILTNIQLEVKASERVALVGRNGAGKSTLLKLITGDLKPDDGEIVIPKGIEIGYLAQQEKLESERTIWHEMMSVFEPLKKMESRLRNMELKMGDTNRSKDEKAYQQLLTDYDNLLNEFKNSGGYQYEANIRSVLHGMRFSDLDYETTTVSSLSGGQKTRLALAKLLLTKPALLILDEPTNHLDIDTLSWLENYLQSYSGALLIVSHDRYFLDKIVTTVYEISRTQSIKYKGNYSHYLLEKKARYEKERKAYDAEQAEIKRMENFIQKNIARASTTKRAQSRRKQLEKIKRMEKPVWDDESARFSFQIEKESGHDVLHIENLSVSYENGHPVFVNVNMNIQKRDRIALVGPNGVGKSTLLKAIMQKIPYEGRVSRGTNVVTAYFDQEQGNLTMNKTVLDELWDSYPTIDEKDIRTVLGNFLFQGEDVYRLVSTLSGGEKARLALAKLMMKKANFLLLDEPTNHLDLDSKEVLEQVLDDYPGTILFVSHDRYFINKIATRVAELNKTGLTHYEGDYDYYIEKKSERRLAEQKLNEGVKQKPRSKNQQNERRQHQRIERRQRRRIQKVEKEIEALEQEIKDAEQQLYDVSAAGNYEKAVEINQFIEKSNEKLEKRLGEWEQLQESIDA